ncbi:MAG: hypothetical protein L3J54_14175 [Draconibacterium sp.]|nr:hypothetical protein [Draconibacterium sp.]
MLERDAYVTVADIIKTDSFYKEEKEVCAINKKCKQEVYNNISDISLCNNRTLWRTVKPLFSYTI